MNQVVERKVQVAGGTALVSAFVVGLLSHHFFKGTEVPVFVVQAIDGVIIAAATWAAAFMAKHTFRRDLGVVQGGEVVQVQEHMHGYPGN